MPVLVLDVIPTDDGLYRVRCESFSAWRPTPVAVVDKAAMERSLKSHATRATKCVWHGFDGRVLDDAPKAGEGRSA